MDDKPVLVQAAGNNIVTKKSPLKYNSFVVLLLKFDNGLTVKITGNGGCIHPPFMASIYLDQNSQLFII